MKKFVVSMVLCRFSWHNTTHASKKPSEVAQGSMHKVQIMQRQYTVKAINAPVLWSITDGWQVINLFWHHDTPTVAVVEVYVGE